MKYIKEILRFYFKMTISNCFFQTCIVLLPIVSIFITGIKYPVKEQIIKPVFSAT